MRVTDINDFNNWKYVTKKTLNDIKGELEHQTSHDEPLHPINTQLVKPGTKPEKKLIKKMKSAAIKDTQYDYIINQINTNINAMEIEKYKDAIEYLDNIHEKIDDLNNHIDYENPFIKEFLEEEGRRLEDQDEYKTLENEAFNQLNEEAEKKNLTILRYEQQVRDVRKTLEKLQDNLFKLIVILEGQV